MKSMLWTLAVSTLALLAAFPVAAANQPKTDTHKSTTSAVRSAWPPESLSGDISMVQPDQKLLVVQDANGVPFDLRITRNTRILSGNQKLSLDNLTQDQKKSVSVKFIPERRGDIAETIRIGG